MNILVLFGEVAFVSRSEILRGIVENADKDGNSVYLFTCEGFAIHDMENYSKCEYNVFRLPEFDNYDGIICDFNSIHNDETIAYIQDKIKNCDKPFVSLSQEDEYGVSIVNEYSDALTEIIEHLIKEHGYKDLHFLSGPSLDEQSKIRENIFINTLKNNGIKVNDSMIDRGEFNLESGRNTAYRYALSGKKMPEAFVCANDFMAVGLIEGFDEMGIKCPEDVAVVGFDNLTMGQNLKPRLTTVDLKDYEAGELAYNEIIRMSKTGKEYKKVEVKCKAVYGESCGCKNAATNTQNESAKLEAQMNQSLDLIKTFSLNFHDVKSLFDFEHAVTPLIPQTGIKYFYYCQYGSRESYYQGLEAYVDDEEHIFSTELSDTVWCPTAYENGKWSSYTMFDRKMLLPVKKKKREATYYIIMPVHRNDENIGYVVMGDFNWSLSGRILQHLVLTFNHAFGIIHQQEITKTVLANINKKWQYDEMTEIYNRSGFYHKMKTDLTYANENDLGVMVHFFDLNGLKKVNDSQGHKAGDEYIKKMAHALRELCEEKDSAVRYGGDEFLLVCLVRNEKLGMANAEKIKKYLNDVVSVSMGSVFGIVDNVKELNSLIQKADTLMYEDKTNNKRE